MQPGRLYHRITIQRPTITVDSHGDQSKAWTDLGTVWAQVLEMTVRERQAASQSLADVDVRIRMRGRSDWKPTPKDRVTWGSRTFDIRGLVDMGGKNADWQLLCAEHL